MSDDRNEALRLAEYARGDEYQRATEAAIDLINELDERIAELEGERDQHKHTATSLLSLLADIRMACGDNGKRMQPELVEFIGSITAERDQLRAEVERLRAAMTVPTIEPNSQNWQGMDGAIAFHLIERHADSWADAGRMMREWLEANAIDHARTTHKDEG